MISEQHIVLIGPSGAGKSTLASLIARDEGLELCKTYTTRPQRSISDTSHVFVSEAEFRRLESLDRFLGTLSIFGYRYGLPYLPDDMRCLVLLRIPAVEEFRRHYPNCKIVEIDAPIKVLKSRLEDRSDTDRFNADLISKEVRAGRQIADIVIDTSTNVEQCVQSLRGFLSE